LTSFRSERVMVFIDGSNMYHSLKALFHRTDIDLGKFSEKLLGKRRLVRMYYYNARVGKVEEPLRYQDQAKFFSGVAAIPYTELRLGRLVYNGWPNSPPYEKGVDVLLATDMLVHSFKNNYDTAVLVACDNDFVAALQAVKDNGKHVEVALFGKEQSSHELRDVADLIIPINIRLLNQCWKQQRQQLQRRPLQQRRQPLPAQQTIQQPVQPPQVISSPPPVIYAPPPDQLSIPGERMPPYG
jgi:uncharacterized LabA/DUF88 family protein